jgi:hypothetical protein
MNIYSKSKSLCKTQNQALFNPFRLRFLTEHCTSQVRFCSIFIPLEGRVGIAQWYSTGEFESRQGLRIFLFTTVFRPALGPTWPPIQWVPGAFSLGIRQPGGEDNHSPPSSAKVKNVWSYTCTPPICLHGVVLI